MNDCNRGRKKKKITYTATLEGIDRAEKALERMGFGSKSNFAKSILISRSTITKFFGKKPIQLDSFKRICEELQLSNWKEIAGISEIEKQEGLKRLEINDCISSNLKEESEPEQPTLRRQVSVIDKQSGTKKLDIVLLGDINSAPNFKIIQSILREHSGDTITIIDIKKGSIRLTVEGSPEDIEQLRSRIRSGELNEVNGFPIENIEITEPSDKWRLVKEIVNHSVKNRSLESVDLSDADLSGADLSGADLSGADLSGADLSGADLSDANLRSADLSDANLRSADLSDANLRSADLSGADLNGAKINEETKLDGKWREIVNQTNIDILKATLIDTSDNEEIKNEETSRLAEEIRTQGTVNQNQISRYLNNAKLLLVKLFNRNLFGFNLSRADLSRANLSGAYLSRANLSRTNLSRAYLSGANLSGADLIDADLSGANLIDAYLIDAYLSRANLSRANLSRTNLSRTNLSGADLSRTNLSGADLIDADLSGANLIDAYLSGAYLSRANLSRANLSRTNLSGANLSGADLSRTNLSGAYLSGANLSGADLSRTNLSGAYLSRANLIDADLSDAEVKNARFGYNSGISESLKRNLIARGAIFEDSPGDRSEVLDPVKR